MDFQHSKKAQDYINRVTQFMRDEVDPIEQQYLNELHSLENSWVVLPIIKELKEKARLAGLWNLFFPDEEHGVGLSNLEYAPLAEIMGRSLIASEIFNCNAPDTGNMEVLEKYGSEQQKEQWLTPLMKGEIRSAFCMTEPDVASSDATNMQATAVIEGDEIVLNGTKWWSTGIGHPDCKMGIFMGLTDAAANKHQQHSMVIFPMDAPGVKIERMLPVFGYYDEPYGHGEISFTNVRVPIANMIAGAGRGFEIAQGRLGPGRIHHCMRLIGGAEKALELMCIRGTSRSAFGKQIANLGGNRDVIANARIAIEQARLLVLKAAWMIDKVGAMGAMSEISQIKVVAPNIAQQIIDASMQMHGGGGLSDDYPLAGLFISARALRLADGPDEVHRGLIARIELMKYKHLQAK